MHPSLLPTFVFSTGSTTTRKLAARGHRAHPSRSRPCLLIVSLLDCSPVVLLLLPLAAAAADDLADAVAAGAPRLCTTRYGALHPPRASPASSPRWRHPRAPRTHAPPLPRLLLHHGSAPSLTCRPLLRSRLDRRPSWPPAAAAHSSSSALPVAPATPLVSAQAPRCPPRPFGLRPQTVCPHPIGP